LAEAASRPAPLDAEQMLFEDEMASVDSALFDETEAETETASTDVPAAAEPKATTPILASVQTARPATKIAPEPAEDLTPEQAAIRSIVRAAHAIEASSAPSLKPAAPDQLAGAPTDFPEPVRAPVRNGTFAPIPDVVNVEAEANAGNAVAQYQYAQVKLSEVDLEAAAAFLRRASQKGIVPAQYELGKLHERGQGVDKDLTEARNLIQKAAEAGHVGAMYDYALFLAEGEGGAKSEADAVTWFQQAAQHGLVDAQYNLGVVHAEGIGTSQDLVTALFWFEIAAKAGDTGAEQEVKNLRTRVSMSDALETSERVKDWKAKQPVALANGRFGAQRWNTGNPLQVKAVQTALGSLGFDAGTPDGVLGRRTGEAISDYQSTQNLEVTGTITPELVKHLNARASGTRSS
ncbi:peptidoglycan-binding protein, partial [Hyphomonas sp.]|uniref:peptidoglycan-binding protein n=1 Tax=Hyphomonas sp. TaxID=87 RepID=UPI00334210D9